MRRRQAPPGRTSISQDSGVKSCGAHQRDACRMSVQAANTRSRGAGDVARQDELVGDRL